MSPTRFEVRGELRRHHGESAWYFLTLPNDLADEIRARRAGAHRPFGSLRVRVRLGSTTWSTSLFAEGASGSYLLPVKAPVRRAESVGDGDQVAARIELL